MSVVSVTLAVVLVSYGFVDATAFDGVTLFSVPTLLGATVGAGGLLLYAVRGGGVGGAWVAVFSVLFALSVHSRRLLAVGIDAGIADASTAHVVARAVGHAGGLAAVVGSLVFAVGVAVRRRNESVSRGDATPFSFLLDVREGNAPAAHDRVTSALAVFGVASFILAGSLLPWSTAIYAFGIAGLLAAALYARAQAWEPSARVGLLTLVAVLVAAYLSEFTHGALLNGVVVVAVVGLLGYVSWRGESAFACLSLGVEASVLLGIVRGLQTAEPTLGGAVSAGVGSGLGLGLVVGAVGYALGWAVRPDSGSGERPEAERRLDVETRSRRRISGDD
ncbi:hypothetical protein [Haloprofundus salilacus]|uniref:hypothetical protein n=1 Tax=Haloprofundus salilacus TaxID=2876190 RepID=UPI001CCEA157|nr:hypothetical protein [Haloprofundus salilacus]